MKTLIYAVRLKDHEALMGSSSGGAFTAMTDVFLSRGDLVVCSSYSHEKQQPIFTLIDQPSQRDAARGSIYVQSDPQDCYRECREWLARHPEQKICFVGLGCQAAGFHKYAELNHFRDRVYVIDIICHGAPSPRLWKDYLALLENKARGKVAEVHFKDKRLGWRTPSAVAVIDDGKEVPLNDYVKLYYNHCALRPSCYCCPYTRVQRGTDMTIGDYWHIDEKMPDFFDERGNSLVLVHSSKGKELFELAKETLDYQESNAADCWQSHLEKPTPRGKRRERFWHDYWAHGIAYIISHSYEDNWRKEKIIMNLKKLMGGGVKRLL